MCSRDNGMDGFKTTFGSEDPWLAIPFDAPERDAVAGQYPPPGVPTLTIVNLNGDMLVKEGDTEIGSGAAAFEGWASRA